MVPTDNMLLEVESVFAHKKKKLQQPTFITRWVKLAHFSSSDVWSFPCFPQVLSTHHLLCNYAFTSSRILQLFLPIYYSGRCKGNNLSLFSFCVTTLNYICKITSPIAQKCNRNSNTYKSKL
jgi:hypothetical protein